MTWVIAYFRGITAAWFLQHEEAQGFYALVKSDNRAPSQYLTHNQSQKKQKHSVSIKKCEHFFSTQNKQAQCADAGGEERKLAGCHGHIPSAVGCRAIYPRLARTWRVNSCHDHPPSKRVKKPIDPKEICHQAIKFHSVDIFLRRNGNFDLA